MLRTVSCILLLVTLLSLLVAAPPNGPFRFVLLGDRTGEAQPGIYERVWRQIAAEHPAFVLSVGDTIQGLEDAAADAEINDDTALREQLLEAQLQLELGEISEAR